MVWRALRTTRRSGHPAPRTGPRRLARHGLGPGRRAGRWRACRGCWAAEDDPAALVLPRGPAAGPGGAPAGPALRPQRRGPGLTRAGHHRAEGHRASRRSEPTARLVAPLRRAGTRAPVGCTCRRLLPSLAALPYYELHPLGLEQRRAVTLIRAAREAEWLEAAVGLPPAQALARLRSVPGRGRLDRGRDGALGLRRPGRRQRGRLPPARTSSAGPWPASRAAMTRACWSCWSRTAASARGSCASWSSPGIVPPRYGPRMRTAPSSGSDGVVSHRGDIGSDQGLTRL